MDRKTPRTEQRKGMRLVPLLTRPRSAVRLALLAHTGALLAQTPQQQAWNILRAGVNEKSTGKRTQARALRILAGDPEALEMAQRTLQDHKPEVRVAAAKAIRKDDTSPVRATAAKALVDDLDPRIGQALVRAASDKSWTVRASALLAIARRGDPELLNAILPALSDKNGVVRSTAAAAVIRLTTVAERNKDVKSTRANRSSARRTVKRP